MNDKKRFIGTKIVAIFFIGLFVTACSKLEEKDPVQTLDNELIEKISGKWLANNYDYATYKITNSEKNISFDSVELVVEKTEGNKIYTSEKEDDKAHCDFELFEDKLIVYRHYEIEQDSKNGYVGGVLTPIELRKKRVLTKEAILGNWESIEVNESVYIRISDSFLDQLSLAIADNEEFNNVKTEILSVEEDKTTFQYINEEQSIRYLFSYVDKENLLIQRSSIKTGEEMQRYILKRR